jgi:DNA-directed RNA polymerase subunit beta'
MTVVKRFVYDKLSKRQRLRLFKHDDGTRRLMSHGDRVEVGQLMEGLPVDMPVCAIRSQWELRLRSVLCAFPKPLP